MVKMGYENIPLNVEYVGVKKGWLTIGGKTHYFKSGFEMRWAKYLELLKTTGAITDWEYEPYKFEFEDIRSGTVFYTPDFKVIEEDSHYWYECKGHLTQRDVVKQKRMAKYYPDEKIILAMQRIPYTYTRKSAEKVRRIDNARKYCYRVIDGSKMLKQFGL
jgi:hypothetical protein